MPTDIATQAERAAELGRAQARRDTAGYVPLADGNLRRIVGGTVSKNPGHMRPSPDAGANELMTDLAATDGKSVTPATYIGNELHNRPVLGDPIPDRTTGLAPEVEASMSALDRTAHEDQASVQPALLAEIDELLAIDSAMDALGPISHERIPGAMDNLKKLFAAVKRIRAVRSPQTTPVALTRKQRELKHLMARVDSLAEMPRVTAIGEKERTVTVRMELRTVGLVQKPDTDVGLTRPWYEPRFTMLGKRMHTQILTNILHGMHDRGYTADRIGDVLGMVSMSMRELHDAFDIDDDNQFQEAVIDDARPADLDDRDQT